MTGLRILYHHRIRADDGGAVHVRELIAALRGLGHEVRECALVPKAGAPAAASAPRRGSGWRALHLPRTAQELMEIGYERAGVRMLRREAASFRPHFIYERHALHCRTGLWAARSLALPLLLEVNSPMTDEVARLGQLRFPRQARRAERQALAGADAVLAVTDVLRQRLLQLGAVAERSWVIGNAAEPARYGDAARAAAGAVRRNFPSDAFVLGFVGYMRPWHRLELALAAMTRPDLARVHLMLVGDGPALPEIRARAATLQIGGRVHEMGVVDSSALPAHLCAMDAALIPAINAYASPLKLFDSLAAGVVTIAPAQPNLREYLRDGDNGLLFRPGDVADLAGKVTEAMRRPEIGANGRTTLLERGWTWEGNARRVADIYTGMAR